MQMRLLSLLLVCAAWLQLDCEAAYSRHPQGAQLLNGGAAQKYLLRDFEYTPTREGYRYSYQLADGTTREEIGLVILPIDPYRPLLVQAGNDFGSSVATSSGSSNNASPSDEVNTSQDVYSPPDVSSPQDVYSSQEDYSSQDVSSPQDVYYPQDVSSPQDVYSSNDANTSGDVRPGLRQRTHTKTRKLALKTLQSLAG